MQLYPLQLTSPVLQWSNSLFLQNKINDISKYNEYRDRTVISTLRVVCYKYLDNKVQISADIQAGPTVQHQMRMLEYWQWSAAAGLERLGDDDDISVEIVGQS